MARGTGVPDDNARRATSPNSPDSVIRKVVVTVDRNAAVVQRKEKDGTPFFEIGYFTARYHNWDYIVRWHLIVEIGSMQDVSDINIMEYCTPQDIMELFDLTLEGDVLSKMFWSADAQKIWFDSRVFMNLI